MLKILNPANNSLIKEILDDGAESIAAEDIRVITARNYVEYDIWALFDH
jgi:hypothetical protein